jgi:hypothetical protein
MPNWTPSHTAQNIIFAIVKLNFNPDKNLTSLPNFKFHVKNSMNKPGDVFHDYSTNLIYGAGIDESNIDNNSVIALNTFADEQVTYAPYPAQKRYTINGIVRTSEDVLSNMQRILASAGSYMSYDNAEGKISVVMNKPAAKALDFDDSNVLGQISVTGTSLDEYYNSVEVQFPYAILKDQLNFVRIDLPQGLRNQNEPDNQLQIQHELVNNVVQASILGNLELRQSREDLAITFQTDYTKYDTQIGDIIGVTNSVYGWANKLFKVLRVKRNDNEDGSITLEINAVSYNEDVFTVEPISDFVPLVGAASGITTLCCCNPPTNITVTTTTIDSQPSISITATVPSGAPVFEMEFWYNVVGSGNKILLGSLRPENGGAFTPGQQVTYKTTLLKSGNYQFTVRAVNSAGSSPFSAPSASTPFEYIQAPNVLPYTTPAVDANGVTLDDEEGNPFNFGMLALYVASKLNWGNILSQNAEWIKDVFGLSDEALEAVQDLLSSDEKTSLPILSAFNTITTEPKSINFMSYGNRRSPATVDGEGNVQVTLTNPLTIYDEGQLKQQEVHRIDFKGSVVTVNPTAPGEVEVIIVGDGVGGGGGGGTTTPPGTDPWSPTPPAQCGIDGVGIGFYLGNRGISNSTATCAGKNHYFVSSIGPVSLSALFKFYVYPVSGASFYEVKMSSASGPTTPPHFSPSDFKVLFTSPGVYSYINDGFSEMASGVTGSSATVPSSPSVTNHGPTFTDPVITGTLNGVNNCLSAGWINLQLLTSTSSSKTAIVEIRVRAFASQAAYPATPMSTTYFDMPINLIKLENTQNYYNWTIP